VFLCDLLDVICVVNRIAYIRLRGIALFDLFDVLFNSISGVIARSVGILSDCRLFSTYELYVCVCFNFVFCIVGDAFDRFINRLFDMRNAIIIVKQCLLFFCFFGFVVFFWCFNCDLLIETIIYVFYMCWVVVIPGIVCCCVEHPKGEYSCVLCLFVFVCSRCRVRCADFIHILLVDVLCRGFLLSDLVAVIGNLDVVFGSVDR